MLGPAPVLGAAGYPPNLPTTAGSTGQFSETGKVSWFEEEGNKTATGIPTSHGGLAVYNQSTLGGWWLVHFPNGKTLLLQQTDIGPAPWTGRKFDIAGGSLSAAGYSKSNFPTDSTVTGIYLGKHKPSAAQIAATGGGFNWEDPLNLNPGGPTIGKSAEEIANKTTSTLFDLGPITEVFKKISETFKGFKTFLDFITSGAGWVRIGKVLLGAIILLFALSELIKIGSGSNRPGVLSRTTSYASKGIL